MEPLEKVVTADGVSFAVNLRRQEGRKQAVKGFVQQHTRSGGGGVEDVLLVEAIFDDTAAAAPPPSSPAVRAQILRQVAAAVCEHALRGRLGDWLDALLFQFPDVARAIKTRMTARVLLAGERAAIEALAHDGLIDEAEEELLHLEESEKHAAEELIMLKKKESAVVAAEAAAALFPSPPSPPSPSAGAATSPPAAAAASACCRFAFSLSRRFWFLLSPLPSAACAAVPSAASLSAASASSLAWATSSSSCEGWGAHSTFSGLRSVWMMLSSVCRWSSAVLVASETEAAMKLSQRL